MSADRVTLALRLLDDAIAEHRPAHVYALFSGGGDSVVAAHIAARHRRFDGCLFVDTGTAITGVRDHAETVCATHGWSLAVRHPPEPYEQMIREAGLPGPGQHGTAYVRLKERVFDRFVRELCSRCVGEERCPQHDTVIWVAGSRASESARRMRNATTATERDGSQVWVNIILDWPDHATAAYRQLHGLPTSDVAALLHRSGECNCGTYAQPGERAMLTSLFPDFADRVAAWENLALDHGHHYAATWGQRPLAVHPDQQQLLPRGRARACTDCEPA